MKIIENELFNEVECVDSILFEQYKMYVESAQKISEQRTQANGFYLTVNAALLAIATWMGSFSGKKVLLIGFAGIIISAVWFCAISNYRTMNACKFDIINAIESKLPVSVYKYEWELLQTKQGLDRYLRFSKIESVVSVLFGIIYLVIFTYSLYCVVGGK